MNLRCLLLLCTFAWGTFTLCGQSLVVYGLYKDPAASRSAPFQLAQLNPFTGALFPLYTLTNTYSVAISTSTYDPVQKRYIFQGFDKQQTQRYYSASVDTTNWLAPPSSARLPIELQYDLQSQKTYGLVYDRQTLYLVSMDEQTGIAKDSLPLDGINGVHFSSSTFNSNLHRYLFVGTDIQDQSHLYNVNVQTGQIMSAPVLPTDQIFFFYQYDLAADKLYALTKDRDTNKTPGQQLSKDAWLVELDTLTASSTRIGPAPVFTGNTSFLVGSDDYDQLSQTLIGAVRTAGGQDSLFLISTQSGSMTSYIAFPDGFSELECDNLVFALKTYQQLPTSTNLASAEAQPRAFPNPADRSLTLSFPAAYQATRVSLSDALGRTHLTQAVQMGEASINLDVSSFPTSIYWIRFENEQKRILTTLPVFIK